jgi:hypothetical protein
VLRTTVLAMSCQYKVRRALTAAVPHLSSSSSSSLSSLLPFPLTMQHKSGILSSIKLYSTFKEEEENVAR